MSGASFPSDSMPELSNGAGGAPLLFVVHVGLEEPVRAPIEPGGELMLWRIGIGDGHTQADFALALDRSGRTVRIYVRGEHGGHPPELLQMVADARRDRGLPPIGEEEGE